MSTERRALRGKPLLVATFGLASVSLTGCLFTSGNLVPPPPIDAGPDAPRDAGRDAPQLEDVPVRPDATTPADAEPAGDAAVEADAATDDAS